VKGLDAAAVTRALVKRGVFTSHGDFYASTIVAQLGHGTDGVVRAGCACYTSADEIERLLEGVDATARDAR
jgi:selenocysteine lyase/cysteine desulfurase